MTRILTFPAASRLLVFAPHPDDETLATGELIQLAAASGVDVRVVFATDGDNNPWPQRWSERRLRIGPAERARWGERRRGEAITALSRLGVAAESARFLGWPDLGLTQKLEDDTAIDEIRAEIERFAPTHVAMPSLADRHPDHGALRVLVELALARSRAACVRLGYVVHGRGPDSGRWRLPRDPARHAVKCEALMAHASQISLSKARLLRWASEPESFELSEAAASTGAEPAGTIIEIPLEPRVRFWRRHDLLIVLPHGDHVERARVRLPRGIHADARQILAEGLCAGRVGVEVANGTLRISVAAVEHGDTTGYVKLDRAWPRVFIFDVETWRRFDEFPSSRETSAARVEPVAVAQRASL